MPLCLKRDNTCILVTGNNSEQCMSLLVHRIKSSHSPCFAPSHSGATVCCKKLLKQLLLSDQTQRTPSWKDTDFSGGELVSQEIQVVFEGLQVARRRGQVLLQEGLGFVDVVLQHDVSLSGGNASTQHQGMFIRSQKSRC